MRTNHRASGRGALRYLLLLVAVVAFIVIANAPSASARRGGRDDCRDSQGRKYDCKKAYKTTNYSPSPGYSSSSPSPSPSSSPGYSWSPSPSPGYSSGSDDNRKGRKYDDNPKGRKMLVNQGN